MIVAKSLTSTACRQHGGDCPIAAACPLAARCPWVQQGERHVPEGCPHPPTWPR